MKEMIYYTFNTGYLHWVLRSEVSDEIVARFQPLLAPGEYRFPGERFELSGYRLVVGREQEGLIASVNRGPEPVAMFGISATLPEESYIWDVLRKCYLDITDRGPYASFDWAAPKEPPDVPWCAAINCGALGQASRWLRGFEQSLAWAWLEWRERNQPA